jgi:hypothetical protein
MAAKKKALDLIDKKETEYPLSTVLVGPNLDLVAAP